MNEDDMNNNNANNSTFSKVPFSFIVKKWIENLNSAEKTLQLLFLLVYGIVIIFILTLSIYNVVDRVSISKHCFSEEIQTEHKVIIYSTCDGGYKTIEL